MVNGVTGRENHPRRKKRTGIFIGRSKAPAFILAVVTSFAIASATPKCFRVGLNGGGAKHLFLNQFRIARMFDPRQDEVPCDGQGYPLAVPFTNAQTGEEEDQITYLIANAPSPNLHDDSVYVLRWDGEGEFRVDSWAPRSVTSADCQNEDPYHRSCYPIKSDSGRMEFRVRYNPDDLTWRNIQFKLLRSEKGNHVRNIRLYLKSQEDLYEKNGEIFNPLYIEKLEPFYMIRFMGAFKTNNSPFRTWEDRTPRDFWNQSSGPHNCGLAYEWAVELCNRTGNHLWFNVPHAANDYAVRKMAELVRDRLDPNLMVYLEYSNETWNYAPPYKDQNNWVNARGGRIEGHVEISKNIFRIWHEVFGKDSYRVKRVMATYGFDGIRRIEECGVENYDVYSPTYYWGPSKEAKETWDKNTTVDEMIEDIRGRIQGGWYEKMKKYSDQVRLFGKELYCYEGGMGGDPGDSVPSRWSVPVYPYWRNYQKLQKDPRLTPLIYELVDTLTSLGYSGGNELSLTGSWEYNRVTKRVSFWGIINSLYDKKENFPKYQGMIDKVQDCDQLIRDTDTIGAGLALRFDGYDDYVDFPSAYKPNDASEDYSLEFWMYPELTGVEQGILTMVGSTGAGGNRIRFGADNRLHWTVADNSGRTVVDITGPVLELNRYHHLAAVKSGNRYHLYVNGSVKGEATGTTPGDCARTVLLAGTGMDKKENAAYFRGRLDELRIWKAPLSLLEIRSWMCRKITSEHPRYTNLSHVYRFDIMDVNGSVADQMGAGEGLLRNFDFSHYSNYRKSGAPIGDISKALYPSTWDNAAVSIGHTNGDRFTVSELGNGAPDGVHVYLVKQPPNDLGLPSSAYSKMAGYYYGVFTTNGTVNSEYRVRYRYQGNPSAGIGITNRLLMRTDNADLYNWHNTGAAQDPAAGALSTNTGGERRRGEYVLAVRDAVPGGGHGPGYALRFGGGDSTEARLTPYSRPDDEYTISLWFKGEGNLIRFSRNNENEWSGTTILETFAQSSLKFSANGKPDVSMSGQYLLDIYGWNHVALIKKDNTIDIYLNGELHPKMRDISLGVNEDGSLKDRDYIKMYIGERFRGLIDEVQIWDIALSEKLIRDWMCRTITASHPLEARHLVTHFRFDEGRGKQLENTRGPGELELRGDISWELSGAPLGDTSVYVYETPEMTMKHPDGDFITVAIDTPWTEEYRGIHLYRVDHAPMTTELPNGIVRADTTRYWGVFIAPFSKHRSLRRYRYSATYGFGGNPNVARPGSIRLLYRKDNSESPWKSVQAQPDTVAKTLTVTVETPKECEDRYCSRPRELLLGAVTHEALDLNVSPPTDPGSITGKSTVCAGEVDILYRVDPVVDADFYVWELPEGLTGYSRGDTILVSVESGVEGAVGRIRVRAGNQYGTSGFAALPVTVQSSPAMSVELVGPTEVCWGAVDVEYSVDAVEGVTEYRWELVGRGTASPSGSTVRVQFGDSAARVVLYGKMACGTVLLATKTVTVNQMPNAGLRVRGSRVCRGCEEYARVTLENSEAGIVYQAYKRGGSAPVGTSVPGTGGDAVLLLPVEELLAGENLITVKASSGDCPSVTLTQTASVIIDIMPPDDLEITLASDPLCPGDTAVILIRNSPPGVSYQIFGSYDYTIDFKPPYQIEAPVISEGGDTYVRLAPAVYHSQMSGEGVGLGNNKVWFSATLGGCPTVHMRDTVSFFLGNEPRFIQMRHDFEYWKVPFDSSTTIDMVMSDSVICGNQSFTINVVNAEEGVGYAACLLSGGNYRASVVDVLTDTVECTTEGVTMELIVPGGVLEAGEDQSVGVLAVGSPCTSKLGRSRKLDVHPAPDASREVNDLTVCKTGDAVLTVSNSQKDVEYAARIVDSEYRSGKKTGDGEDLNLRIPNEQLASGVNRVVIEASTGHCDAVVLRDTATVTKVSELDGSLSTRGVYKDLCIGVAGEIVIYSPEPGVKYRVYHNSKAMSEPVIGEGDSIVVEVPAENLESLAGTDFVLEVQARVEDCEVELAQAVAFTLSVKAYPEGGIDVFDQGGNLLCPDEETVYIGERKYDDGGLNYPMTIQGLVNGVPVGTPVLVDTVHQHDREPNIGISFPREEMPVGDTVILSFAAKLEGCPPKKIPFDCRGCGFDADKQPSYIVPDYDLDLTVLGDTVCSGHNASVTIIDPQGSGKGGYEYRLYDSEIGEISAAKGTQHWSVDNDGNLSLSPSEIGYLKPGLNEFHVQVRYRSSSFGECGWVSLNSRADVLVNGEPDRSLKVIGTSICAGDGSVTVERTQTSVLYQAYLGNTGVSDRVAGTGGTINLSINGSWLNPGSNEISVRATIPGCVTVPLDQRAVIQLIDHAPSRPGAITGPTEVCAGATQIQYSVPNDPEALDYTWNLPPGATTGSNTNIALVDFGTRSGPISVVANSACGASPVSQSVQVTVSGANAGGIIAGPKSAECGGIVSLTLSGHEGRIVNWQWSEEPGVWVDIYMSTSQITYSVGGKTATFRAIIDNSECGRIASATHTVNVTPCSGSPLQVPIPNPSPGEYTQEKLRVYFGRSPQDSVRDIYYKICSDISSCTLDDGLRYDHSAGITLDLASGPKWILYRARPKPGLEDEHLPSAMNQALYVYAASGLGEPVPRPGGGFFKDTVVNVVFEKTKESPLREIYYTICDGDTTGCELTLENRNRYDSKTGIDLNLAHGPKSLVFQAVPLDVYAHEYQASIVAKALYTFRPGIAVIGASYLDADGDGRIDLARIEFEKELVEHPESITLAAPYDQSETVTRKGVKHSDNTVIIDFSDTPFSRVFTGFDPGPFGFVNDTTGRFHTEPFSIQDSVAPVISSAQYLLADRAVGGEYFDTLRVVFTEPVMQKGNAPFVYAPPGSVPSFEEIDVQGAVLRGIVRMSESRTPALEPGVMIAVNTQDPQGDVRDGAGNVQENPGNRRVPIVVASNAKQYEKHYGPTLFTPGKRDFVLILRANPRLPLISGDSEASIKILDAVGNVIRSERFYAGEDYLKFAWDGRNANGRYVGQGTYLLLVDFTVNGVSGNEKMKIGVKR